MGRKNRAKAFLSGGIAALLVLLAALLLIYRDGRAPDQVTGLTADPCYKQMNLTWDEVPRADGYYVYISDADGFGDKAEVSGDKCKYAFKDYTHDHGYQVRVSAYTENKLTGKKKEGKASETLTAQYDSSQYAQKIPILTYHKIVPDDTEVDIGLLIRESDFDQQMKYLHDNGFTTITPDEFYKWHKGKKEFPKKTVMITFDDGYYGVYHLAYPIIKKYDQAMTVFCIGEKTEEVTADFDPDDRQDHYIGRDVIEKVRAEYPRFTFESHTYDMHSRVKGKRPAKGFTYEQILEDCEKNEKFGFTYLAYPWGTYSKKMIKALKASGYKMAFTYKPFYYAKRSDDTYIVNRVKIFGTHTMDEFIRVVNGEMTEYDLPEEG